MKMRKNYDTYARYCDHGGFLKSRSLIEPYALKAYHILPSETTPSSFVVTVLIPSSPNTKPTPV